MTAEFYGAYKGYELNCTPQLLHNGSFGPSLELTQTAGSQRVSFRLVVPDKWSCETAQEAAEHACAYAQSWIDEHVA